MTALRSTLYACSDADLFSFRQAGGLWDIRRDPPEHIPADHPVALGFAHLRSLWEQRWWLTPSALLSRVVDERHAFLLAFGEPRPREVWRRLRFLLDQARAFEEAGGARVRSFLSWAEVQRTGSSRVHEPLLPESDDLSVRIMTVHGAKGLEFPITILSGMTTRPGSPRRGVSVVWNDDGKPEIKLGRNVATQNHDLHADIESEMDVHEKLRLLYVACTRAQDHLIVSCHHNVDDRSYADRIWRYCAEEPTAWQAPPELAVSPPPLLTGWHGAVPGVDPPSNLDRMAWTQAREELFAPQRESRFISATAIAAAVGAVTVAEGESEDPDSGGDESMRPVAHLRRGRAGTAIGRAVHATLQIIDLEDPHLVDSVAARQAEIESVPELTHAVAAMVRSALAAPVMRMLSGQSYHKEMYVAAPIGERVIEGYVDLLVETANGLVVIDYKTDGVASEAEVDAKLTYYELQGAAYAVAIEAATGLTVTGCHFVFCRPAGAIDRQVADLAAAKDRVRLHLLAASHPAEVFE